MMQLVVKRFQLSDQSTIGELSADGEFVCYTLEDKDRQLEILGNVKIKGMSAIPRGNYRVTITFSNRFQKELPLIEDVPGFTGVRIHTGNTSADTEGCILVGMGYGPDVVTGSRNAFAALFPMLGKAVANDEPIFLTVA